MKVSFPVTDQMEIGKVETMLEPIGPRRSSEAPLVTPLQEYFLL